MTTEHKRELWRRANKRRWARIKRARKNYGEVAAELVKELTEEGE